MTPHWKRHLERQEREREARRISQEYRQAQREAALAGEPHKVCTLCKQSLPLSAYSPRGPGKVNSRCRPCHSATVAAQKRAKRAALTPDQLAEKRAAERAEYYSRTGRAGESGLSLKDRAEARQRREAERQANRAAAKAARVVEAQQRREAERAEANAARIAAKAARAAEAEAQRTLAKAQAVARRQVELEARQQAKREARQQAKLETQWRDAVAAIEIELANACLAAVEAQAKAQRLAAIAAARAAAERRRQVPYVHPTLAQRLAHLWPPERHRTVALRDGSRIPIGELARRHWWREQLSSRRFTRYSQHWR